VTRAYKSELRRESMERTRERILAAFVDELAAGKEDFSVGRVAERAGVSVRSVYQHLPNRDAQIDAVAAWIEAKLGPDTLPTRASDLQAYARRRYDIFRANERVVRAQLATGVAGEVRRRRRRKREQAIDACTTDTGCSPRAARLAGAMLKHLISGHFGVHLLDLHGLTIDEVSDVGAWTIGLVLHALERGDEPG
jgi:AcrR family transcriptional regulator